MYLIHTKLETYFIVSALSQFMSELRHIHWVDVKHILRYICGTIGYGIRYIPNGGVRLNGYTESNWASSAVDRKSTSECCFSMGSIMISLSS